MKWLLHLKQGVFQGFRDLRGCLRRANYDGACATQIWGGPPVLIVLSGLVCGITSGLISGFIGFRNPFSMSFPTQVYPMFLGLLVQPITLFAMLLGFVLKKRATHLHGRHRANLVRPMLGGFALVLVCQQVYLLSLLDLTWSFHQLAPLPINLLKATGLTTCWGLIFLIASLKKGPAIVAIISMFFTIHGTLFGMQFIPDMGLLQGLINSVKDVAMFTPGGVAAIFSLAKATGFALFALFLFENIYRRIGKLSEAEPEANPGTLPPPIPQAALIKEDTVPNP